MPNPLGGSVEDVFVEIYARADKLIEEAQKARDLAKKSLEEIGDSTDEVEGKFTILGGAIATALGMGAVKAVEALVGALQKVFGLVVNITQQAVGMASSYESVMMTFTRLLGSEQKSLEFMTAIREQAASVGQNFIQMAMGAKMFVPYAERSKDAFLAMIQAQMGLAAADPMQGMMGAALALREFLSGTYLSLAQRFELPRKRLAQILKDHKDVESRMEALNELLAEFGMGFTLVSEQAGTLPGILGQISGVWQEALLALGQPVMEELRDQMSDLLTLILDNKEEIIKLAARFGEFIARAIKGLREIIEQFVELGKKIDETGTKLAGPDWIADFLNSIKTLGAAVNYEINARLWEAITFVKIIIAQINRLREGRALMTWEEMQAELEASRQRALRGVMEFWFPPARPEEPEEPAPGEPEAEPEEAPFALSEKAQKALAQGAQKIERILQRFQKKVQKLQESHTKKMLAIDEKERKQTEKALDKHQKQVEKLQKDYYKTQVRNQEDFNKQWRRLIRDQHQGVLDADWEFQYEEERLIAEGDTLALKELRDRYAHEKEVRAREQADARGDAQEDFRQEQSEREQDFRDRLLALQTTLGEQLTLIAQNAEEERQKERENAAERLADAQQSRDDELARIGEWLASVKGVNAEELQAIKQLWAEVYGDIANKGIEEGLRAHNERMRLLGLEKQEAQALAAAYSQIAVRGAERAQPRAMPAGGYGYTGPVRPGQRRRYAQFGLDEVFTRPTSLIVGEGGMPEHVQVTPLGGGGGGISGRLDINVTVSSAGALSPEAESNMIIALTGALEAAIEARETR